MTAIEYIITAFVIVVVSFVFVRGFDAWDARRVAACIRSIGLADCPRCRQKIGADAATTATRTMIKYSTEGGWRLRGRDRPSQLLTVVCPHCSAELQFRMDGSLFCCDHEIVVA